MKTACFTGHRLIPPERVLLLEKQLDSILGDCYAQGFREFICGGALGFDTLAARAVLRFRDHHPDVRLRLAIPCADQPSRWMPEDAALYRDIMARADQVNMLSDRFYAGCMLQRNRFMVEHADLCICYWNGQSRGGTAFTVRYAASRKLDLVNLFMKDAVLKEDICSYTFISLSAKRNAATVRSYRFPGRKLLRRK